MDALFWKAVFLGNFSLLGWIFGPPLDMIGLLAFLWYYDYCLLSMNMSFIGYFGFVVLTEDMSLFSRPFVHLFSFTQA